MRAAISWSRASCRGDRATADLYRAGKSFEDGYRPQVVSAPKARLDLT